MDRFLSYFKRHGLKLFLSNLAGVIGSFVLLFIIYGGFALIVSTIVLGKVLKQIQPLFAPNALQSPATAQLEALASLDAFIKDSTGLLVGIFVAIIILLVITIFVKAFTTAGAFSSVNEVIRHHQSRFKTYFIDGLRFLPRMFGLMLMMFILYLPALIITVVIAFMLFSAVNITDMNMTTDLSSFFISIAAKSTMVFIIFLISFFLTNLAIVHAPLIMVAENVGVFKSIGMSFRLLTRSFGKVFVSTLLMLLVGLTFGIVLVLLELPNALSILDPIITGTILAVYSFVLNFIIFPIVAPITIILSLMILTYRYYKYLRANLFSTPVELGQGNTSSNPTFSFKEDDVKTED